MSLHNEIMNISARPDPDATVIYKIAYKQGHRDARHVAAEMSLRLESRRDQLAEALRDITEEAEEFARALPPYQNSEALAKARAALKQLEEE